MNVNQRKLYNLSLENYIEISNNDTISYGGNQGWFEEKIRKYGCGLIGIADLLLYLSMTHPSFEKLRLQNEGPLDIKRYGRLINQLEREYFCVVKYFGLLGPFMAHRLRKFSKDYQIKLKCKWGVKKRDILPTIIEMIQKNIPVIISIGPWYLRGIKKTSLRMKYTPDREFNLEDMVDTRIDGHYVVVTGILVEEYTNETYLRVSSWGKMYYINYHEYIEYTRWNYMTSNILYLNDW